MKSALVNDNQAQQPFLSIVIPAYNEEARLPGQSAEPLRILSPNKSYPVEVVIVNNNSRDRTGEIIEEFAEEFPFMRGLFESDAGQRCRRPHRDAGRAAGRIVSSATPISRCPSKKSINFYRRTWTVTTSPSPHGKHLARCVTNEPWYRHLMGRVFNTIVRLFAVPGLQDTQCGFKMFRAEVAENLFPLQTMNGWSFDVEILYAARQLGLPHCRSADPLVLQRQHAHSPDPRFARYVHRSAQDSPQRATRPV